MYTTDLFYWNVSVIVLVFECFKVPYRPYVTLKASDDHHV